MTLLMILGFSHGLWTDHARAQDAGSRSPAFGWSSKRAEVRAQTRWSLDEWLKQRERMKWSDLWLQMNSPSPYEFFVNGSLNLVPQSRGGARTFRYGAGAYVTIFGVEFEHTDGFSPEDHARFHVRFFGNSLQNTSLTAHLGVTENRSTGTAGVYGWSSGVQLFL